VIDVERAIPARVRDQLGHPPEAEVEEHPDEPDGEDGEDHAVQRQVFHSFHTK
jgi:hypothetical protein